MTSQEVTAQLSRDCIDLILGDPTELMWSPGCVLWGLALVTIAKSPWVALSIPGVALMARERSPWHYEGRPLPDLTAIAARLASNFKHAEPPNAPGAFLYRLDEGYGRCGRGVVLAVPSEASFPWISEVKPSPGSTNDLVMESTTWEHAVRVPRVGNPRRSSLLPAPTTAADYLREVAHHDPRLPGEDDASYRRRLELAILDERRRLEMLREMHPKLASRPEWTSPPWLGDAQAAIDVFLATEPTRAVPQGAHVLGTQDRPPSRRPQTLPRVRAQPVTESLDGLPHGLVRDDLPPITPE